MTQPCSMLMLPRSVVWLFENERDAAARHAHRNHLASTTYAMPAISRLQAVKM